MTKNFSGILTLNHKNYTIEMDKKFAAASSNPFSEEYAKLQEVRRDYPKYKVVVTSSKAKETTSGLDFEFMEVYIEKHDDEEKSIMTEYMLLRAKDETSKAMGMKGESYLTIRAWFLEKYPEVKDFISKREKIVEELQKKREADRKAKQETEIKERRAALLAKIA